MAESIFTTPEGGPAPTAAPAATAPITPEPQAPAPAPDPNSVFANQLAGIQTDDGRQKYVDVPTALASIPHAQEHINSLAAKNAELEAELAKRAGMEDVLQRIESSQTKTALPSVQGLDETAINALVEQSLSQREQANVATANQAKVVDALTEKYGDKAEAVFAEKAKQLGVDVGFLTEISLRSPEAALAYFDSTPAPASNPVSGGMNTTNLNPNPTPVQDHMKIFTGGEDALVSKWRSAAAPKP